MMKSITSVLFILLASMLHPLGTKGSNASVSAASLSGGYSVTEFGAKGDGLSDDTAAFQSALDTAEKAGGGIVHVPTGKYLIQSHLVVPRNVTLEGIWRAPQRGVPVDGGSTLLAVEGKGDPDGIPFITLRTGATLSGISVFYPEQIIADPPLPYPWTIRSCSQGDPISPGEADNCSIIHVTLINPYQAVDFGTYATGRHYINGLYAHALYRGLYIDQCYDVGRIENIHFWPFWDLNSDSPLWKFTQREGIAFTIGRTDGQMASNLFSIFYRVGMHFIDSGRQPGSGVYTNCYMDVSPCAIQVDAVMANAGISFVNGMFMSTVEVGNANPGTVKFTGCGFWATPECGSHARLEGLGSVLFESCHFSNWDRTGNGAPCLDANNRSLIVTGCEFITGVEDDLKIRLGKGVRSAVIANNLMPGGEGIANQALPGANVQITANSTGQPPAFLRDWWVLGGFPNPKADTPGEGNHSRIGLDVDYLKEIGGEAKAALGQDTKVRLTDMDGHEQTLGTRRIRMNGQNKVNLKNPSQSRSRVSYAFACVESATDQEATFFFGSNDSAKVWVNGELIHTLWAENGRPCLAGNDVFTAHLKQGTNSILVKVEDGGGHAWEFTIEGYGEKGEPLQTAQPETLNAIPGE
jgi:hypothetical protein